MGSSASQQKQLADRLAHVESRIGEACRRAHRDRASVSLVAVTKTVPAEVAGHFPALGLWDLGENRPQELWKKSAQLPADIRWHMIGHLQTNKIEKTLPLVHLFHSVDRLKLLEALEKEASRQERKVEVFLEIHTSGEASKQGFSPADFPGLLPTLETLRHVRVRGLMTMAALQEPEACRPSFALLRDLRDRWRSQLSDPHHLEHLSMGMSNDFEVAIEEGATHIRLGTVLYEGLAGAR